MSMTCLLLVSGIETVVPGLSFVFITFLCRMSIGTDTMGDSGDSTSFPKTNGKFIIFIGNIAIDSISLTSVN